MTPSAMSQGHVSISPPVKHTHTYIYHDACVLINNNSLGGKAAQVC